MVEIREWKRSDAGALAKLLNNKKILDNLRDGLPYPYTESDALDYINSCLSSDKNAVFCFAIVFNDNLVGSMGVFRQQNIHRRTAEIGYYVGEKFWGNGIATNAVKLVTDYVFENTDIVRIFAEPFADNTASCRVLEKSGFVFEGVLRNNAFKNGKIRDMIMYSLVR